MPAEEERRAKKKKEEEEEGRKKMNKIEIFVFGFSILWKVSGTHTVDLALEKQWEVVCKLFELLYFIFLGAAPIHVPYVLAAILNMPHHKHHTTASTTYAPIALQHACVAFSGPSNTDYYASECHGVFYYVSRSTVVLLT